VNQRHGPCDDGPWFFMRDADLSPVAITRLQPASEARCVTEPLLISVNELAQTLGVSTRTAWRLNSSGGIPSPIPVGGLKRWRREEIVDWITVGCPARRDWRWRRAKQSGEVIADGHDL
jgi:excisionase family DNA binding protein